MRARRSIFLLAGALVSAAPSFASLVPVSLNNPGDELVTRDTINDLDWLDWNQGLSLSYFAMLAELQPGGQYEGWLYATAAELSDFMASGNVPDPGGRTVANIPSVLSILSLVGANDYFGFLGPGNSSAAFLHDPDNLAPGSFGPFAVFTIETFDNPVTAKAGEIGAGLNDYAFGMGHALVRAVPEPGTIGFLAMGSLGLLRRRRGCTA